LKSTKAIMAMKEEGIDISRSRLKSVDVFLKYSFDYVITVCGGAKETCPSFVRNVKHHLHIGFDDLAEAVGTDSFIISEFRRIRNEIKRDFYKFYLERII